MKLLVALLISYLVGTLPTAYLVGRTRRIDVGAVGSGNYGATNVYRAVGPLPAALTLVVDAAKGALPVLLLPRWLPITELEPLAYAVLIGIATILGHVFSIWIGFRGGKGIGTAFGVFLALAPWAVLGAAAVWVAVVLVSRLVSLASLAAAVFLLVVVTALHVGALGEDWPLVAGTSVLVVFLFWTHRSNIERLRQGEEQPMAESREAR